MSLGASKKCQFGERCNRILCPYRHSEMKRNSIVDKEIVDHENSEKMENDKTADEIFPSQHQHPKKDSLKVRNVKTNLSVQTAL